MLIQNEADYQRALILADQLLSKPTGSLTTEEKQQLNLIMKAIQTWHFQADPVPVIAAIP